VLRNIPILLIDRLGRFGRFCWSAWAGLAALSLLAAAWQFGHEAYGDFILPAPLATLNKAVELLHVPANWDVAAETTRRALQGFLIAGAIGLVTGIAAGYSPASMRLARPLLTVMLGVPPIAWIVLTMIWFGSSDATVVATILVAATPFVFATVAEGVATRDRGLDDMAKVFGASPFQRVVTIAARQVSTHVFPALTLALGTSFKIAIMAELLANAGGIGGALAMARANLDVEEALAWVAIAVSALIAIEYGLLEPVRGEVERWRDAARPWGVKR